MNGKVAVVIGGHGHLGSVLSKALFDAGAEVVILDKHNCDVTKKYELEAHYEKILKQYGRIDVLLNMAGLNAPTPFMEIDENEINAILRVHLHAVIYSCQVFGSHMVNQRSGSIINFASVGSGPPLSRAFVYSMAKAGVVSLTQNLAREWAPFNVRVNALKPGFFPTQWSMEHFIDDKRQPDIIRHTPMGRFGKPEELIGAVKWLAGNESTFVTGSIVTVDGGFSAMTI